MVWGWIPACDRMTGCDGGEAMDQMIKRMNITRLYEVLKGK